MTQAQKMIKYGALALAALLILGIVCGVVDVATYFLDDSWISKDLKTTEIVGEVSSLDLELRATSLKIRTGEVCKLETNNERIEFEHRGETLSVRENGHSFFGSRYEAVLILTLPENMKLNTVKINSGAGKVEIEALSSACVDFDLGAGEVRIGKLHVSDSADIDGGAGRIEIGSGSIASLDLDMGVGELVLCAALHGNAMIDCGVGSTQITLIGTENDYSVDVSKGLGEVTVNGESVRDGESLGNGKNKLDVSGGIGSISIRYQVE